MQTWRKELPSSAVVSTRLQTVKDYILQNFLEDVWTWTKLYKQSNIM